MIVRFWRALLAVIAGNTIYFGILRFLPQSIQHQPFHIDWGLAVDLCICLVCYGIFRLIR
jgi:hypothetical protein